MKKIITCLPLVLLLLFTQQLGAQRGHPHKHKNNGRGRTVVVKRSVHRPAKVKVFYPAWRPHHAYHRRWVYFPRRNFYWDNWRGHYVFWNGNVWISQPAPPPGVEKAELEKEKHNELPEADDDVDDVYKSNNDHQQNKPDK